MALATEARLSPNSPAVTSSDSVQKPCHLAHWFPSMPNSYLRALCLLFLPALLIGCSEPRPEFGEVEGVIRVKGEPCPGLVVRFLPDPGRGNDLPINAIGRTDEEGKYQLQHYYRDVEGLGAPVGWHRVIIEDSALSRVPQGAPLPPAVIPRSYANPTSTPLQKEVKSGQQTIDFDFDS